MISLVVDWANIFYTVIFSQLCFLLLPTERFSHRTQIAISLILLALFMREPVVHVYQLQNPVNCNTNAYRNT